MGKETNSYRTEEENLFIADLLDPLFLIEEDMVSQVYILKFSRFYIESISESKDNDKMISALSLQIRSSIMPNIFSISTKIREKSVEALNDQDMALAICLFKNMASIILNKIDHPVSDPTSIKVINKQIIKFALNESEFRSSEFLIKYSEMIDKVFNTKDREENEDENAQLDARINMIVEKHSAISDYRNAYTFLLLYSKFISIEKISENM